jgi:hypothetical protein
MKNVLLTASLALFGVGAAEALVPVSTYAANAGNPYGNVDHSNDAGNDTGDSRVEGLNSKQLDGNYQGSVQPRAPSGTGMAMPEQPGAMPPPPGVMPPPPGVMPPPPTTVR